MGRLNSNQEYSRSVSVPTDRPILRTERGSHLPRLASSPEEKYLSIIFTIIIIIRLFHDLPKRLVNRLVN